MKATSRILIAFVLNLGFSIFELVGGLFTGSVAIASDALHDFGDALSIGISYFLERKSAKRPDDKYTFGYARYSILGALITTAILMAGSLIVIYGAGERLFHPEPVDYDGMMILAIIGFVVSIVATLVTGDGHQHGHSHGGGKHEDKHKHSEKAEHKQKEVNINQRAVSLHMFEDALGWLVVFLGSVLMHFTDISMIDPILSIAVALFIFLSSLKNLGTILNLFLEKAPANLDGEKLILELKELPGVIDAHHLHLWSLDGERNFATLHVVISKLSEAEKVKAAVKAALGAHGISHVTVEIEDENSECKDKVCH